MKLSPFDLDVVKINIRNGDYIISPVYIYDVTIDGKEERIVFNQYEEKDSLTPNTFLKTNPKDLIVITGMAIMLQQYISSLQMNIPSDLSFRVTYDKYYNIVCSQQNIMRIYSISLSNTIMHITKDRIFQKLSPYIVNKKIHELMEQILNIRIFDAEDTLINCDKIVPVSSLLFDVLLSFYLFDLDKEVESMLQFIFPNVSYYRYADEIMILFPTSCSMNKASFDLFECKLINSLSSNYLKFELSSIGPGDAPMSFNGGYQISIKHDGSIDMKKDDVI